MTSNQKVIELIGVGLPNRGAEFMAATVINNLKTLGADFVTKYGPDDVTARSAGMIFAKPLASDPNDQKYHCYKGSDDRFFDVVARIDISGFAYGDFWGEQKFIKRALPQVVGKQRFGIPFYVMPQSMGAFHSFQNKNLLRNFIDGAGIFCVRDMSSFAAVESICPWAGKKLPDICFSKTTIDSHTGAFRVDSKYATIIVNSKLIQSGVYQSVEDYLEDIKTAVAYFRSVGLSPVLLNHEGLADLRLIKYFSENLDVYYFQPKNISEILEIIRNSDCVFTSRYHGLVSALKFEVPVVVVGWSAKYRDTLEEYYEHSRILKPGFRAGELDALLTGPVATRQIVDRNQRSARALAPLWSFLKSELSHRL